MPHAVVPPQVKPKLSPFGKWKVLKDQVQVDYFVDKFNYVLNADKADQEIEKADHCLLDYLLSWMMELLTNLMSHPCMFTQTLRNRDQANSLLRGRINS